MFRSTYFVEQKTNTRKPWIDNQLIQLAHRKRKIWHKYKETGDPHDHDVHRSFSNAHSEDIRKAKQRYKSNLVKKGTEAISKYTRSQLTSKVSTPIIRDNGTICDSNFGAAEALARKFGETFTPPCEIQAENKILHNIIEENTSKSKRVNSALETLTRDLKTKLDSTEKEVKSSYSGVSRKSNNTSSPQNKLSINIAPNLQPGIAANKNKISKESNQTTYETLRQTQRDAMDRLITLGDPEAPIASHSGGASSEIAENSHNADGFKQVKRKRRIGRVVCTRSVYQIVERHLTGFLPELSRDLENQQVSCLMERTVDGKEAVACQDLKKMYFISLKEFEEQEPWELLKL
ncbi:unnamed protein product [Phaedon cochleariae]|uniref:Uncharacterized protein n=1 Tax=Phaedon cochleariae TaxID=80249 RepID=A0A9N9SAR6_PHACE|nr:unnamed protein product [Phaedon cochleariae]